MAQVKQQEGRTAPSGGRVLAIVAKIVLTVLLLAVAAAGGSALSELIAWKFGFGARTSHRAFYQVALLLPGVYAIWFSRLSVRRRFAGWCVSVVIGGFGYFVMYPVTIVLVRPIDNLGTKAMVLAGLPFLVGFVLTAIYLRLVLSERARLKTNLSSPAEAGVAAPSGVSTSPSSVPAPAPSPAAAVETERNTVETVEMRLERLKSLYDRGLIGESAYRERQREILNSI